MSAVVLAIAALLLQVSAVPQNLIPGASATSIEANPAAPPSVGAFPHAGGSAVSGTAQPEELPPDFRTQPVPGVAYVPGRLRLEPVAPARSAAVAPAFRSAKEETRARQRTRRAWRLLGVAQHTAATFDAWSTRRAIASSQGRELNPLLRPFAGNASLYVAIQAGPVLLDYLGRRMMTSRHGWARHTWWVPQAVGTAVSLAGGFHNLSVSSPAAVP